MNPRLVYCLAGMLALLAGPALAAEPFQSGPQPGARIPSVFSPRVVFDIQNPSTPGEKVNLVCRYAYEPMVMVLAREVTDDLGKLLKKLDAEVAESKAVRLRVFAVILAQDGEAAEKQLRALAKKENFTNVSLAIERADGLKTYQLVPEADLTVLHCRGIAKVEANHSFRKGELDEKAIGRIVADVDRIASFGVSGRLRAWLGLAPGESTSLTFTVSRRRFQGPVTLTMKNHAVGVTIAEVTIPADKSEAVVKLSAAADAPEFDYSMPLAVTARGPVTETLAVSLNVRKLHGSKPR